MSSSEKPPAPEREVLRGGPDRAPLLERLTPAWRRRGAVLLALVLGVIAGGAAAWWWDDPPSEEPRAPLRQTAVASPEVRLILTGLVVPTRNGTVVDDPLRVDAVLLHSLASGTAAVTRIHRAGGALRVRAAELPVALSVNHPIEQIRLRISPQDCRLATEWTPSAQPFTLTWRDERGTVRTDTGGDHDASMNLALVRYFDAVCDLPAARGTEASYVVASSSPTTVARRTGVLPGAGWLLPYRR